MHRFASAAALALLAVPRTARAQTYSRYVYETATAIHEGVKIYVSEHFPNGQPDITVGGGLAYYSGYNAGVGVVAAGPLESSGPGQAEPLSIIYSNNDPSEIAPGQQISLNLTLAAAASTVDLVLTIDVQAAPQGAFGCLVASDCTTDECIGGICCSSQCGAATAVGPPGACQACAADAGATADGTCTPLSGTNCDAGACATNGICSDGACVATPISCPTPGACQTGVCDPDAGCTVAPVPAGTPCRAATCVSGGAQPAAVCDGSSPDCPPPSAPTPCGLYACAGGACRTSCATDADCAPGDSCASGGCVVPADAGVESDAGVGADGGAIGPGADAGAGIDGGTQAVGPDAGAPADAGASDAGAKTPGSDAGASADAGTRAPEGDAGASVDAGTGSHAGTGASGADAGTVGSVQGGCGCGSADGGSLIALFAVALWRPRRRRSTRGPSRR